MATMLALKRLGSVDRYSVVLTQYYRGILYCCCCQHNRTGYSMRPRTPEGTSTAFFSPVERLTGPFLSNLANWLAIGLLFTDSIHSSIDKSLAMRRLKR